MIELSTATARSRSIEMLVAALDFVSSKRPGSIQFSASSEASHTAERQKGQLPIKSDQPTTQSGIRRVAFIAGNRPRFRRYLRALLSGHRPKPGTC